MDLWGFALDMTKVVVYRVGVPVQKIGVFLCLVNSVINPFIYFSFMPPFRQAVRMTLSRGTVHPQRGGTNALVVATTTTTAATVGVSSTAAGEVESAPAANK